MIILSGEDGFAIVFQNKKDLEETNKLCSDVLKLDDKEIKLALPVIMFVHDEHLENAEMKAVEIQDLFKKDK
jgi:hypothetical protein